MLNLKVRMKNKTFWLSFIPAALLLIQAVAKLFGFTLELEGIKAQLLEVVNAVFVLLTIMGVVVDPTTSGVSDSMRALAYSDPADSDKLTRKGT